MSRVALARECATFTRFLIGCQPDAYVQEKYSQAHQVSDAYSAGDRFETILTRFATAGPILTRIADAYARLFAPRCKLRNKLVLLLAILETCAPYYRHVDRIESAGVPRLVIHTFILVMVAVACLIVGIALFLPLQFALRWVDRTG